MKRDPGPLPVLLVLGGFIAVSAALELVDRYAGRGRPTELRPGDEAADPRPDVPPTMKISYLESALQDTAPGLRVIHRSGSADCLVLGPDVDPATLAGLPPTEEYADCWRGVVLCEAEWEVLQPDDAAKPDGPHACRVGDFRLFGYVKMIERIRPVAERIAFGPYRGVGGPATRR